MRTLIGFEKEFEIVSQNLNQKKLNNSILVCGNKGIGKYFFVTQIIEDFITKKINQDNINHHLTLLNNNTHPNIRILQKKIDDKTGKLKNNITIDQVRELNNFFIETSVIENFPKFIIIDSADYLNLSSSNALLKILEEPKINTYFFLVSHQPSSLLPTIKSRCLKINFPSHNFKDFESILLSNNISFDEEILKLLFDITNGSPGISFEYNFENIKEQFDKLKNSLIESNIFSDINNQCN
jgi:DNA polymerase III, gamma/tau subunits